MLPPVESTADEHPPEPTSEPTPETRRWHLKLRGKVMVLLMFASLGPLLLASSINVNRSQDQFKRSVRGRYAEGARLTATAIGAVFERVASDLFQTGARLDLTRVQAEEARRRLDAGDLGVYLERHAGLDFLQSQSSAYLVVFMALADGRVFRVAPYHHLTRIPDLAGLPGFRANGQRPKTPLLGNLTDIIDAQRPRPVALEPLHDREGVWRGWLGVVLRTEVLSKLMEPLTRGSPDDAKTVWMLVDGEHRIAAHSDPVKVGREAPAEVLAATELTGELTLDGVDTLYSRAPVPETRWQVVLLREAALAYREVSVLHWILSAVIGLTLAFVLLLADYLAQVLLRPIHDLERGAQMMGAGALDYRIELATHATDELGHLARNFNEMGENLQRNRQSLRAYSRSLENAHAELDALVHGIRHDLKASLVGIQSGADGLTRRYGEVLGEDGRGLVDRITTTVSRVHLLADDLVRLVARERGRPEASRFALQDLLEEVRDALNGVVPGALLFEGPLPELEADRAQIRLVLLELVENGLRHNTSAVPQVRVTAEDEGLDWRIELTDNGVGVPPEARERIFEVFVQLDAEGHPEGSGTGLTVARRIAEEHRGQLTVEPAEMGSRFVLRLPKQPMLLTSPGYRITDGDRLRG